MSQIPTLRMTNTNSQAAKTPAMVGYQAEGSAPFKQGAMVDNPETIATAIRIGHPQSWDLAHEVFTYYLKSHS
jgi:threonine synthase